MSIRRDLHSHIAGACVLAPALYTSDQNSDSVDLRNLNSCTFFINVGVGGITFNATDKIEFKLQESDDNSTWTAVSDAKLVKAPEAANVNGIVKSLIAAHAAKATYKVGYLGYKRYARIVADYSGTHGTGTGLSITAIRGHLDIEP